VAMCLSWAAFAGPPTFNAPLERVGTLKVASYDPTGSDHLAKFQTREDDIRSSPAKRLDLSPPELDVDAEVERTADFASTHRNSIDGQNATTPADSPKDRPMSRAEEFTRRVHREGLPIARPWQSKSALISLGLNQKGKPGLWLIQKTR
jgi:hypothetical protein